ncbi:MAG: PDDEXK nuclease domain-containing protein [Elusimicrobiota bacterium]|nr:PDDEXK nuclease domain-containing protein [Elusimicrobiota bacterium]
MIGETRSSVAAAVNIGLTMLYWKIGKRVNDEILRNKRAGYGEEILATLSQELIIEHGSSFSEKNLRRMVQFSEVFSDEKIVVSLIRQLSWTHFIALIPLKKPLEREFYAEMCRVERWSVRTLRGKIDSMLFERTALSKKPEQLARMELSKLREEDKLTPDLVFRDPYFLDFLGLKGSYQEKDLESAILREIEAFIMELGAGFSFVARQKRITIDNDDFYIDLLFYHRKLKRLVVIDLKLGKFKAAYKGQMELYLRWLEKYETEPGEQPPLGLILCAEGNNGQVELLQLDKSGIHVAEYLTALPPKELLQEKLHKAIGLAKRQVEQRNTNKEKK